MDKVLLVFPVQDDHAVLWVLRAAAGARTGVAPRVHTHTSPHPRAHAHARTHTVSRRRMNPPCRAAPVRRARACVCPRVGDRARTRGHARAFRATTPKHPARRTHVELRNSYSAQCAAVPTIDVMSGSSRRSTLRFTAEVVVSTLDARRRASCRSVQGAASAIARIGDVHSDT